jgi:phage repressor protein C with HTH and peptisase S24 domain
LGHEIRILSENDRYPPKVVKGVDMELLHIVGKVIGWNIGTRIK